MTSKSELKKFDRNYCLFSDYVYRLDKVYNTHPGGYQIVKNIRGREIDRFIYGGEPLEILGESVPRFSHTRWAMSLAGPPIAKFSRVNPYLGMIEQNECKVERMTKLSS